MVNCPKCGSVQISGPRFDKAQNMMRHWCDRCGYEQLTRPLDYNPITDVAELLRRKAQ